MNIRRIWFHKVWLIAVSTQKGIKNNFFLCKPSPCKVGSTKKIRKRSKASFKTSSIKWWTSSIKWFKIKQGKVREGKRRERKGREEKRNQRDTFKLLTFYQRYYRIMSLFSSVVHSRLSLKRKKEKKRKAINRTKKTERRNRERKERDELEQIEKREKEKRGKRI